jgi:uncharacterized protein YqfA (UPF0365 family)
MNFLPLILLGLGTIAVVVVFTLMARYLRLWVQSYFSSAGIGLFDLVAMSFKKVNPTVIVRSKIMAVQAGLGDSSGVTRQALEAHALAGGRVPLVVQALIAANKARIRELDFKLATAIDLAGRDVREAVQTSVYPKVIDCPNPESGRTTIDGVAKDGIQVKVKARVTVRTHLDRFVGGAKEETIIARVGEGIVSTIGTSDSYKHVLESPDSISKTVLARGLDVGTAFEILSIDIADVDVGENVGAKLQEAQAEANKSIAQAQAEIRRAAAVAVEQEMKARVQEMQAKVVEAQAQVPLAMAEAFRQGRLGVMDYYKMENVQADSAMRQSIAQPDGKK